MNTCIICPVIGTRFKSFYRAPKNYDSYIIANNPEIKPAVEKAGWKYVFIDIPLSDDEAVSSLQSKYVKFLQFMKDEKFSDFKKYDRIIVVDHKLRLKDKHVKEMLGMQARPILMRDHPKKRKNVWEEVGMSMLQERYLRAMPETIDYIREKIKSGYDEVCDHHKVCTTGLALYDTRNQKVWKFLDELYGDIAKLGTSQCQIVWFMTAQNHADIIQVIGWDDLDIRWRDPAVNEWLVFPILKIRRKKNKTIWRLFGMFPVFAKRTKNDA